MVTGVSFSSCWDEFSLREGFDLSSALSKEQGAFKLRAADHKTQKKRGKQFMAKDDKQTHTLDQASSTAPSSPRRDFLKFVGMSAGAVALFSRQTKLQAAETKAEPAKAGTAQNTAPATNLELVKETDPLPKGLGYVADAKKGDRKDKAGTKAADQTCLNCQFYTKAGVVDKAEVGKCQLFPKGVVKAEGWCKSWIKKPG